MASSGDMKFLSVEQVSMVLVKEQDFSFNLDQADFKITGGDGEKLKRSILEQFFWVKALGSLKLQGFFYSKVHPKEGMGTYELAASGRSNDGIQGGFDYCENPFSHRFVNLDIKKDSWCQICKKNYGKNREQIDQNIGL